MICLFCLNESNNGFSLFGESEEAENARDIILQHFWFDIDEIEAIENCVCCECWFQIKSFHEFYLRVEEIHFKCGTDTEEEEEEEVSPASPDPVIQCDDIETSQRVIGLEIDFLEPNLSEHEIDHNENSNFDELNEQPNEELCEELAEISGDEIDEIDENEEPPKTPEIQTHNVERAEILEESDAGQAIETPKTPRTPERPTHEDESAEILEKSDAGQAIETPKTPERPTHEDESAEILEELNIEQDIVCSNGMVETLDETLLESSIITDEQMIGIEIEPDSLATPDLPDTENIIENIPDGSFGASKEQNEVQYNECDTHNVQSKCPESIVEDILLDWELPPDEIEMALDAGVIADASISEQSFGETETIQQMNLTDLNESHKNPTDFNESHKNQNGIEEEAQMQSQNETPIQSSIRVDECNNISIETENEINNYLDKVNQNGIAGNGETMHTVEKPSVEEQTHDVEHPTTIQVVSDIKLNVEHSNGVSKKILANLSLSFADQLIDFEDELDKLLAIRPTNSTTVQNKSSLNQSNEEPKLKQSNAEPSKSIAIDSVEKITSSIIPAENGNGLQNINLLLNIAQPRVVLQDCLAMPKHTKNETNTKMTENKKVQNTHSLPLRRSKRAKTKLEAIKLSRNFQSKNRKCYNARVIENIICYMCHKPSKSIASLRKHLFMHDSHTPQIINHGMQQKQLEKGRQIINSSVRDKQPKYDSLKPALLIRQENEPQKLEHASTHPNQEVNKVQCDICSMWLENRYLLFIHRKIHMHFPQKCQHCDKVKFNMPSLRSHIRFSHAPPTHKCHVCGKSFIRPKTLKVMWVNMNEHMAGHIGKTLYDCLYCPKSFNSDANMYKHMRLKHLKIWNIDRSKKKSKLKLN